MVGVVLVHVRVEHHTGVGDADLPSRLRSVQRRKKRPDGTETARWEA